MIKLSDQLLPYQKRFAQSDKRFKLFLSSRQVGKSFVVGYELVKAALSKKNGLAICGSTGARAASELLAKAKMFAEVGRLLHVKVEPLSSNKDTKAQLLGSKAKSPVSFEWKNLN